MDHKVSHWIAMNDNRSPRILLTEWTITIWQSRADVTTLNFISFGRLTYFRLEICCPLHCNHGDPLGQTNRIKNATSRKRVDERKLRSDFGWKRSRLEVWMVSRSQAKARHTNACELVSNETQCKARICNENHWRQQRCESRYHVSINPQLLLAITSRLRTILTTNARDCDPCVTVAIVCDQRKDYQWLCGDYVAIMWKLCGGCGSCGDCGDCGDCVDCGDCGDCGNQNLIWPFHGLGCWKIMAQSRYSLRRQSWLSS